jgi:glycosyltransferase involved in cell wall biosynthesis
MGHLDFPQEKEYVNPQGVAKNYHADVLVIHFTMSWKKLPFLISIRLLNRKSRIIMIEHSYSEFFEKYRVGHDMRFRLMLNISYSLVDQIVSVSYGQMAWLKKISWSQSRKIIVIPCVPFLQPFEAIPLLTDNRSPMLLGAFGRFHEQKGFETLIEAMRDISPDTATLVLAGYGENEEALKSLAHDIPNVIMEGKVNAIEFITRMDAILMPSRWEPGAVTCWETRAGGRPMIVSNVDGLPEQIINIGFIVQPDDVTALHNAIMDLYQADRVQMSKDARESTRHAFEDILEKWSKLLTNA